jgi:sensor histidine kinase YesM
MYIGLLLWIAIGETLDSGGSWYQYVSLVSTLCLSQLPVLWFSWERAYLKKTIPLVKYRKYQVACFGIYLPLLALCSSLMLNMKTAIWEVVLSGAVYSLCLEIVLLSNHYYTERISTAGWIKRLSLSKAIFISILSIAFIFAALAVSSLDNPPDHTKNRLIGFEFNLVMVLARFDTLVSYWLQLLFIYLCGYFFFVINSRFLVGKVLKNRGILLYILSTLAFIGIFYPFVGQMLAMLPFSKQVGWSLSNNPFEVDYAFGALNLLLITLPVVLTVQWYRQNTLIVSLEKEKAEAQLDLLKQQLNPHFFFNTLNNLYALSLRKSKDTPEVILQLSELMRYVIYKAKEPYVQIGEEVRYLQDYIRLQSIRLKEKFDLSFELEIREEEFKIVPLLLIIFIENAFKHGIERASGKTFLHISLKTKDNKLYFSCHNSFESQTKDYIGIGLTNLQKRLQLLYPGQHHLEIKGEGGVFKAKLTLENYALPDRR